MGRSTVVGAAVATRVRPGPNPGLKPSGWRCEVFVVPPSAPRCASVRSRAADLRRTPAGQLNKRGMSPYHRSLSSGRLPGVRVR